VSKWPSSKARIVLAALLRIGWTAARTSVREGWPPYTWAFHDDVEIGPVMLAKIAKATGLRPEDL
jgi:predicted RNA binding protein YcfA (HicA-like mRNA interferase family)